MELVRMRSGTLFLHFEVASSFLGFLGTVGGRQSTLIERFRVQDLFGELVNGGRGREALLIIDTDVFR